MESQNKKEFIKEDKRLNLHIIFFICFYVLGCIGGFIELGILCWQGQTSNFPLSCCCLFLFLGFCYWVVLYDECLLYAAGAEDNLTKEEVKDDFKYALLTARMFKISDKLTELRYDFYISDWDKFKRAKRICYKHFFNVWFCLYCVLVVYLHILLFVRWI